MEPSQETNIKVPFISKLAYGFGDVGCNFSWMFVGNFLMIFYTDICGYLRHFYGHRFHPDAGLPVLGRHQ